MHGHLSWGPTEAKGEQCSHSQDQNVLPGAWPGVEEQVAGRGMQQEAGGGEGASWPEWAGGQGHGTTLGGLRTALALGMEPRPRWEWGVMERTGRLRLSGEDCGGHRRTFAKGRAKSS